MLSENHPCMPVPSVAILRRHMRANPSRHYDRCRMQSRACFGLFSGVACGQPPIGTGTTGEAADIVAAHNLRARPGGTSVDRFICKQCGRCCLHLDGFETTCSPRDISRWERLKRYDILAWVETYTVGTSRSVHEIWIHPRTGDNVLRCPWLRKLPGKNRYVCRIHACKPERCRNWQPDSPRHAREIGCRGFGD